MTIKEVIVPNSTQQLEVGIFFHHQVALGPAFLFPTIFETANRLLGFQKFSISYVSSGQGSVINRGPVSINVSTNHPPIDLLLVPPISGYKGILQLPQSDFDYITSTFNSGATIASACLGALVLANSGVLNGVEATTHWQWVSHARSLFGKVHWDETLMICDRGKIITSGGFLSAIDLAHYLLARYTSKPLAHEVGQYLLADSIRQKQSVYAEFLVSQRLEDPRLVKLDSWVESNLNKPISIDEMAAVTNLSPRSFFRFFSKSYGLSPNRYLQLKRIEKARLLLRDQSQTIGQVLDQIGIADLAFFRKIFIRELGISPAEYRKKLTSI